MDKVTNRTWILLFCLLAAVLAAVWFLLPSKAAALAGVYQDGALLMTLAPQTEQTVTVEGPAGKNVIVVENGEIFVQEADCPDGVCVKHGPLSENGTPIICLPNRLVIRWLSGTSEVDGISGRAS